MAKDPYGFGTQPNYREVLSDYLKENEKGLRRWVGWRPSIEKTYDELLSDVEQGNIKYNPVPRSEWKEYSKKHYPNRQEGVGAFFGDNTINFPDDQAGIATFPHEIKHYFASHQAGRHGVPEKINPLTKLDMELKGWLPSLHPGGRRATVPEGPFGGGKWWNENIATQSVDYSDKHKYHPWFDEHAFDKDLRKFAPLQDIYQKVSSTIPRRKKRKKSDNGLLNLLSLKDRPVRTVKTKGGDYPIYKTKSKTAQSFRDAFSSARKTGNDIFEWQGRKYTSELA